MKHASSSFCLPALAFSLALAGLAPASSQAKTDLPMLSDGEVRIGVLTDLSSVYADASGRGSVLAAQMAIDDFIAQESPAFPIRLLSGDMQLKPDVGSNIARGWFDREGVDMITDLSSSAVTLAVMGLGMEKNRVIIPTGPASLRITNEDCNPLTMHWAYDEYSQGQGTARAVTEAGNKTWFFIEADYAGGRALRSGFEDAIKKAGGSVLGTAKHALGAMDFSSQVLQAQSSGARVIGMANAAGDTANLVKQAAEFNLTQNQILAAALIHITDIHGLGLQATQGMYLTDGFYWDLNDETRDWSQRFFAKQKKMPTMVQAGTYSAVLHYLKGVKAAGTDEAHATVAAMKSLPVNDVFARNGTIRPDGRMVHDMYLFEVKSPETSKGPWDYYQLRATIPAENAFKPLSESTCKYAK